VEECSRAGEPVDLRATVIPGLACAPLFECKLLAKRTVKTAHTSAAPYRNLSISGSFAHFKSGRIKSNRRIVTIKNDLEIPVEARNWLAVADLPHPKAIELRPFVTFQWAIGSHYGAVLWTFSAKANLNESHHRGWNGNLIGWGPHHPSGSSRIQDQRRKSSP
jgi:hypothetical protein